MGPQCGAVTIPKQKKNGILILEGCGFSNCFEMAMVKAGFDGNLRSTTRWRPLQDEKAVSRFRLSVCLSVNSEKWKIEKIEKSFQKVKKSKNQKIEK